MKITIGSKVFKATLFDNETTKAFKALLPMSVTMTELNGNEKYFHLSTDIPTNSTRPGTIKAGDLMLYGGNSVVLFYETFSSSYSYTKLGRIDDVTELAKAVGKKDITVTFELVK